MDNKSRYSFMFGDLATQVALDIGYRIGRAYRWAKKPYISTSCKQDLYTFLCFYRAKQGSNCEVNEASNKHAANVLKASSFVSACERTVRVRSPYSLESCGGS